MRFVALATFTLISAIACGNAEAEKAAADAKQKAFMEAEAQARSQADDAERKEKIAAATQKCTGGDSAGCLELGKVKREAKDAAGAQSAFDSACDKGSVEGCQLAAQGAANPTEALARWRKGCDLKDANACVQAIGAIDALSKKGQAPDAQLQLELLDKGCTLGHGRLCTALGVLTKEADIKRAIAAFERGCTAKEPTACVQLADIYRTGTGVKKNLAKADELLKQACDLGLVDVCALK
jgi:TPR repeat protein